MFVDTKNKITFQREPEAMLWVLRRKHGFLLKTTTTSPHLLLASPPSLVTPPPPYPPPDSSFRKLAANSNYGLVMENHRELSLVADANHPSIPRGRRRRKVTDRQLGLESLPTQGEKRRKI